MALKFWWGLKFRKKMFKRLIRQTRMKKVGKNSLKESKRGIPSDCYSDLSGPNFYIQEELWKASSTPS